MKTLLQYCLESYSWILLPVVMIIGLSWSIIAGNFDTAVAGAWSAMGSM